MKKQALITNKRDRNLLIILLALIIGALIYFFLIKPSYEQSQVLLQQRGEAVSERDRVRLVIENLGVLQQNEPKLRAEITEKYGPFFYDLNAEKILNTLDTLMTKTGVKVVSYVPSGPALASITVPEALSTGLSYPLLDIAAAANSSLQADGASVDPNQQQGTTDTSTVTADAIPKLDVTLGIGSSSYSSIMAFIGELEKMNKAVVINSVMLNRAENALEGQIMISLYALPKLDTSEAEEYTFDPSVTRGRSNPFN